MKETIKTFLKENKKVLIIIISIVIMIFLLAGFSYVLKLIDSSNPSHSSFWGGDASNPDINMNALVESRITSQISTNKIVSKGNGSYKIDVDLDEEINSIYDQLINTIGGKRQLAYIDGTDEEKKEVLKNMVRAEIVTQYPDLRTKEEQGKKVDSNEVQGVVKFKRQISQNIKKVEKLEKSTITSTELKGIVCWGDEFTLGDIDNPDESYPAKLGEMLESEKRLAKDNVYNLGFYGDTAEQILLRDGVYGYSFKINEKEEIDIGGNIGSEISFDAVIFIPGEDGEQKPIGTQFTNYDGSDENKIIKCTIDGIEGELTYDINKTNDKYTFKRTSDGESVSIDGKAEIIFETQDAYNECVPIIWMGNNNDKIEKQEDINQLIKYYNDLINTLEKQTEAGKIEDYIVIPPTHYRKIGGTQEKYTDVEYQTIKKAFEKAFGNRMVEAKGDIVQTVRDQLVKLNIIPEVEEEENPNVSTPVKYKGKYLVGDIIELEYIPLGNKLEPKPGTLMYLIENKEDAAFQYFSIDSYGNLIVANWSRTTTITANYKKGMTNDARYELNTYEMEGKPNTTIDYKLNTVKVNYKSSISKYTLPFDYLWTFIVMSDSTKFANDLTSLAVNSKIEATLYDELAIIETDTRDTHDEQNRVVKTVTSVNGDSSYVTDKDETIYGDNLTRLAYTYTKVETNKVKYRITYADVWSHTYKVTDVKQVYYEGKEGQTSATISGSGTTYNANQKDISDIELIDGIKVHATITVPDNPPDEMPLIVMCHGYTGNRKGDDNHFIELGKKLAESGIASITIDFPGCGDAEEDSTKYTLSRNCQYIEAAIKYMKKEYKTINDKKIGIVGHSMGGRIATEYFENVKVAALWAPALVDGIQGLQFLYDSPDRIENYKKLDYGYSKLRDLSKSKWGFEITDKFIKEMEASHPIQNIVNSKIPTMVVFGDSDDVIPKDVGKRLQDFSNITYFNSDGGNHNLTEGSIDVVEETYKYLCNAFGIIAKGSESNELSDLWSKTETINNNDSGWKTISTRTDLCSGYKYEYDSNTGKVINEIEMATWKLRQDSQQRTFNYRKQVIIKKSGYTYTEGKTSTIEKTYKNKPSFVYYYINSGTASNSISSTYSWLFKALENNARTEPFVDITKYMLFKATGDSYGVTILDWDIYDDKDFIDAETYDPIQEENPGGDGDGNGGGNGGGGLGHVELDGSYNVRGILLSNPVIDSIAFVGSYSNHGAVDINPTRNGGTPVYAAADGQVTTAGYHSSYGNYVIIQHGNGVSTLYAHAQSLAVSAGKPVKKGDLIMYEGTTGNSNGPHVHFEIRINGVRDQALAEDMFRQLGYKITYDY